MSNYSNYMTFSNQKKNQKGENNEKEIINPILYLSNYVNGQFGCLCNDSHGVTILMQFR